MGYSKEQKTGAGYVNLFIEDDSKNKDFTKSVDNQLSDIIVNNFYDKWDKFNNPLLYKKIANSPILIGPGRNDSLIEDKKTLLFLPKIINM